MPLNEPEKICMFRKRSAASALLVTHASGSLSSLSLLSDMQQADAKPPLPLQAAIHTLPLAARPPYLAKTPVVSRDHQTLLHVFALYNAPPLDPLSWGHFVRRALSTVPSILPTLPVVIQPPRDLQSWRSPLAPFSLTASRAVSEDELYEATVLPAHDQPVISRLHRTCARAAVVPVSHALSGYRATISGPPLSPSNANSESRVPRPHLHAADGRRHGGLERRGHGLTSAEATVAQAAVRHVVGAEPATGTNTQPQSG